MAQGGEQEERVNVTFSLPTRLAAAVTEAARSAGRLTPDGHVVMDHMLLASPAALAPRQTPGKSHWKIWGRKALDHFLDQPFEGPSNHLLNPD